LENLSSITIGYLASRKGSRKSKHWKRLRVLLDSGCGATLINQSLVGNLKTTKKIKQLNGLLKLETLAHPINARLHSHSLLFMSIEKLAGIAMWMILTQRHVATMT
jgi:hypothetical protein